MAWHRRTLYVIVVSLVFTTVTLVQLHYLSFDYYNDENARCIILKQMRHTKQYDHAGCDCQGVNVCYAFNGTLRGKPMACSQIQLFQQVFQEKTSYKGAIRVDEHPAILTGASSNHYNELLASIATTHRHHPRSRLIVYDLGLWAYQREKLLEVCDLELRTFDFSAYPSYFEDLKAYRWKTIIIANASIEFPDGFWWIDSSVRWHSNTSLPDLYESIRSGKRSPYILVDSTGHSSYKATNPRMYEYLPTSLQRLQDTPMFGGGFAFVVGNAITSRILEYLVLCALEERCYKPPYSQIYCSDTGPDQLYAKCHRYDQSAINILLANEYNFDHSRYTAPLPVDFANVDRTTELDPNDKSIRYCRAQLSV